MKVMPFRVIFLIILEEEKKAPEANSLKLSRTLLGRRGGSGVIVKQTKDNGDYCA